MESPNDKLQKMSGAIIKKRGQNADLLRKQFLASLDLNQPVEIESQDQYNYEVNFFFIDSVLIYFILQF